MVVPNGIELRTQNSSIYKLIRPCGSFPMGVFGVGNFNKRDLPPMSLLIWNCNAHPLCLVFPRGSFYLWALYPYDFLRLWFTTCYDECANLQGRWGCGAVVQNRKTKIRKNRTENLPNSPKLLPIVSQHVTFFYIFGPFAAFYLWLSEAFKLQWKT